MKQSTKTILMLVGFAALLGAAFFGYRALSQDYANMPLTATASPASASEDVQAETAEAPEVTPMPAPDFTVTDGNGAEVKLSDFLGKPVVVNFWATWCGPCKSELPAFDKAYAEYGDDVAFLMVNLTDGQRETVEGVKAFVEEGGYSFPVYYDTTYSASSAYGVYSIPMTLLIDADGLLVGGQVGAVSESSLMSAVEILKNSAN